MSRDPRRDDLEALLESLREDRARWTPEQRRFASTMPPWPPPAPDRSRPPLKAFLAFFGVVAVLGLAMTGLVVWLVIELIAWVGRN